MLGKKIVDYCSNCDCGVKMIIVNKTRYLCESKNRERLDRNKLPKPAKTLVQVKASMKQATQKKTKQNENYKKVCQKIDEDRGLTCESCGTTSYLSHSHLVPRSRRQDLIDNPDNIKIQCTCRLDGSKGCHQRYEDGEIDDFVDRQHILTLVERLDSQFFNLKFNR